jgi:hypothetical protein
MSDTIIDDIKNSMSNEMAERGYIVKSMNLKLPIINIENATPPNISYNFSFDILFNSDLLKLKYNLDSTGGVIYNDREEGYYASFDISATGPDLEYTFHHKTQDSVYGFSYPRFCTFV